jgi:hypothetical protein
MPIIVNDPLTWVLVALGWTFVGTVCILFVASAIATISRLLGTGSQRKWLPLLISILAYLVGITIVTILSYIGNKPDWYGILGSYTPIIAAPVICLLGKAAWPHN